MVDVIFFLTGTLNPADKEIAEPWLEMANADLFSVPAGTEIYHYNEMEDIFDDLAGDEQAMKDFMIEKIQVRQELLRGGEVKPAMIAREHESAIDIPLFNVLFNHGLLGRHITALKLTVTHDRVDCG